MDGLFELLIIAAIFLLPALEAWAKKRRRERGRRGEEAGKGGPVGSPSGERSGGVGTGRGRVGGDEGGERSAGELLPEDLWEELTGDRRRADAEAGSGAAPEAGRADVEGRGWDDAPAPDPTTAPGEPLPRTRVEPEPAPWRETGRAEAEPGATDLGGRMGSGEFGWAAGPEPPPTEEPAEGHRAQEPRRAEVIRESGGRPNPSRTHRSRIAEIGRLRPGRAARRGAAPAGVGDRHPLIGDLDRDALRRAVVYAEILGPPVSMREG